jgi:hypothetical protein
LTSSVVTKTQSLLKTFTSFSTGSFILETTNTGSATTFSQSLAHITIKNVNPLVGNIDKINVYIKSKATGGATTEYQLIGTKLINEPITGSLTDIYSDTKTNLTESTYTFIFNPPNKNTANDIKVEYLNSLNDFANYESVVYNHYFQGYNAQSTGGDITELSQSLSSLNDTVSNVSSSLTNVSSSLTNVSSSLIKTIVTASSAYSLASGLNNIIPDAPDGALTLNLTATAWNNTTPPSGSPMIEENQKNDWSNGDIPIIRNPSRNGLALNGVLADPDGFLQIKLQSDLGGASGFSNVILFLPYYTSSYTP